MKLFLANEKATIQWATRFANLLSMPVILSFEGEIGSGKSTFIRALLQALGIKASIKSPTYSLIESYEWKNLIVHHIDLYRIEEEAALEYIGFRDLFQEPVIACIEWPQRAGKNLPPIDIKFHLQSEGTGRSLQTTAYTSLGQTLLSSMVGIE